jgi:cellulose synthase/poly-beta-1,6-N-acetylglucosamine synthase-like glycosyltransferase
MSSPESVIVSILLAARDEEANIERCLLSLEALNFPVEKMEILIGDDDSSDRTAEIIRQFIGQKSQFKYTKITSSFPGLKGKANVLAQLARNARGKYLFFCDADIAVQPQWLVAMLKQFKPETGIVVGLTRMKKSHFLADFLSLEWLFALTVMRICSLFKIPVTGMGNNMALTRESYEAVGGYEKIGFSIVEDYALFMAVARKGYGFCQAYTTDVLSESEPVNSLYELQIQRKRWMQGVMQSFWATKLSIILSACLIPFLAVFAIWFPVLAGYLLLAHYSVITITAIASIMILRQTDLWKTVFFFWFFMFGHTLLMLYNYMKPGKMIWKGRTY